MIYVTPKELVACFARYVVQQSPYLYPDNLCACITEFSTGFDMSAPVLEYRYPLDLMQAIHDAITRSPECLKLNERKNGDQRPYGIVTRYGKPEPDDDFIDLDALTSNIFTAVQTTQ